MKRFLYISVFALAASLSFKLFSADHKFGGTSEKRHKEMIEDFNTANELSQKKNEEEKHISPTRKYLTGDWNGARTKLADNGVTIGALFATDILGNPLGGLHKGFAYVGSAGIDLNMDLEKLIGMKGTQFYVSAVWRTGTNLSAKKIGNQFTVSQLYGGMTVLLNELYVRQHFFDNKLVLKAGRLDAGNNFFQSDLYYNFVNNAFCGNPVAPFFSIPFTAYPHSTWGAYARIAPIPEFSMEYAVYNANADITGNTYHGTNFTFKSTQGALFITEWGYHLNPKEKPNGMPGNYIIGAYYITGKAQEFTNGKTSGNFMYYFLLDQMIYQPDGPGTKKGLTPFVTLLFSPKNKNLFPFFLSGGLVYEGLFAKRPHDRTNIGIVYGQYSKTMRKEQENAIRNGTEALLAERWKDFLTPLETTIPQTFETVLELNHWFNITEYFYITPDIQYIINPRGLGNIKDALVIGAQMGITF